MSNGNKTHGLEYLDKITGLNKDIVDKFLEKRMNKNKFTGRAYQTAIETFFSFYGEKELLNIRQMDINDFFDFLDEDSDKWTLSSKKQMFSNFKTFIMWFFSNYQEYLYGDIQDELKKLNKKLDIMDLMNYLRDKESFTWREKGHKLSESNKEIILELDEVKLLFDRLVQNDIYKYHYIIYKTILETGMRRAELSSIDLERRDLENHRMIPIREDLANRLIYTYGKTKDKVYYISEHLKQELLEYLIHREKIPTKSKAFFLTNIHRIKTKRRYDPMNVYFFLRDICESLGFNKSVSPHTLRKTTNTFRKTKMNCPEIDLKILLGHKTQDVNIMHYIKMKKDEYLKLFDKYYPYSEILSYHKIEWDNIKY